MYFYVCQQNLEDSLSYIKLSSVQKNQLIKTVAKLEYMSR